VGFERHGLVPDIVTLGKPMGNGYPIAGIVAKLMSSTNSAARRAIQYVWGNPVACAAAMATLDVIEEEGLIENARDVGTTLKRASRFSRPVINRSEM